MFQLTNILINIDKNSRKSYFRSRLSRGFYRIALCKVSQNSHVNTYNGDLFLVKLQALTYRTLFKLDPNCRCFPTNFPKLFRTRFHKAPPLPPSAFGILKGKSEELFLSPGLVKNRFSIRGLLLPGNRLNHIKFLMHLTMKNFENSRQLVRLQ